MMKAGEAEPVGMKRSGSQLLMVSAGSDETGGFQPAETKHDGSDGDGGGVASVATRQSGKS